MGHFSFRIRIALSIGFIILSVACNRSTSTQVITDYDQLCQIYENTVHKQIMPDIKEMEISKQIEKDLPRVFEDYSHIITAAPDKMYSLFKQSAKLATSQEWDCPVMDDYFSGKFDYK